MGSSPYESLVHASVRLKLRMIVEIRLAQALLSMRSGEALLSPAATCSAMP